MNFDPYSANGRFGPDPTAQLAAPQGTPEPPQAKTGAPAHAIATRADDASKNGSEAAMAVVVIIGVAVILSQLSFSGVIKVTA